MGDDRPIGYEEKISKKKTQVVYRASATGACLTALVAARLEYKPARPDYQAKILNTAAAEGNLHEPAVVEALKEEHGYRVWGSQDTIEIKVIPGVIIRGHTDGTCIPPRARKERTLEVKTMSDARFKKWKAAGTNVKTRLQSEEFSAYGYQISTYMHANKNEAVYVVKNRSSGELDIAELKVMPFEWRDIKKKLIQAEMWVARGELPPCAASSGDQFFCEYPYLHDSGDVFEDEPEEDEPVYDSATEALVAGMAAHYVELQGKVSQLKPFDDERKDVGKKILEAMPGEQMRAGGFEIKTINNKRSYQDFEKAAKKLGVDAEELKEALDTTKTTKKFPYVSVKKVSEK